MRVLGKGLAELIGEQAEPTIQEVPVSSIEPNQRQPRTHFDEAALAELAESIREHGLLQPLVVRPLAEGTFELIAGERRLRASKIAGLRNVPVVVRAASNRASLEMALVENLQREDISPLESAKAYRKLQDEFGLTQEEVAEKVGKARATVANTMRLLKLPRTVLDGLERGVINEGHARALLAIEGEAAQIGTFNLIVERGLTVREVERIARPAPERAKAVRRKRGVIDQSDPSWQTLQDAMSEKFGTRVRLEGSERGGQILVDFYSEEDLVRIADVLGISL